MNNKITIAIDAMGGDNAPRVVIEGASEAKTRYPDITYLVLVLHRLRESRPQHWIRALNCHNPCGNIV